MTMKKNLIALALCAASPALFADGLLSDAPEEGHQGNIDLGYISTSGNTETESLNGAFDWVARASENWATGIQITGVSNSSEDQRDAEQYTFAWNNRFDLTEKSFVYSILDYKNDYFGAYDYQAGAYLGYGHQFYKSDDGHFSLGIGLGYRVNAVFIGEDEKESVIRGDLDFAHKLTDNARFTQTISAVWGQEIDTYVSRSAISTKISENLAMKLSYLINYNSVVPAGAEKTDRTTTVGISYSF
ncbi:YdiY family protein [Kangiella marina]|uniref:YdiY family protein n=2 Tax=Kangiella marina TaxID=1079178 RepID=A0ABP8IJS7_9GAMM